jgi:hypothetical protein
MQSAMAPALRHFAPKLWYIANFYDSTIDAYTIPGLKLDYSLTGTSFAQGMCTLGRKTFWVVNSGADDLLEFESGGKKPIKTLYGPTGDEPAGCSVDPTTGNIAASVLFTGGVLLWKGATGPVQLMNPLAETYFIGYDGSGDLFVDGFTSSFTVGLAELPKGSSTWTTLSLPVTIGFPGQVQWDGTYLAVGDQTTNVIYRLSCSGASCTLAGRVMLGATEDCTGFWIRKAVLACGDGDEGKLYHYPAGGAPFAHVSGLDGGIASVIVK